MRSRAPTATERVSDERTREGRTLGMGLLVGLGGLPKVGRGVVLEVGGEEGHVGGVGVRVARLLVVLLDRKLVRGGGVELVRIVVL